MDQFPIVRIVVSLGYLLILGVLLLILIRDLVRGKTENWSRNALVDKGKYGAKVKNNILVFTRKESPREYWGGILLRAAMVAIGILLGFVIYDKLF